MKQSDVKAGVTYSGPRWATRRTVKKLTQSHREWLVVYDADGKQASCSLKSFAKEARVRANPNDL